jgi:hypothetical protein
VLLPLCCKHSCSLSSWNDANAGVWWDERRIGTQLAPTGRDASIWEEWLPSRLELWHPDMSEWRRRASAAGNARAQRMQRLVASTQTSAPTARDISDPLPRILSGKSHNDKLHKELWEMPADAVVTESTVEEFWTVLLPFWSDVRSVFCRDNVTALVCLRLSVCCLTALSSHCWDTPDGSQRVEGEQSAEGYGRLGGGADGERRGE